MPPTAQPPASGFKPEDLLFVIFRHKWKIIVFSLMGFAAAVALYLTRSHMYQSEAKLLLRYVLERKSIAPIGNDAQIQSPDARGENIINSELEILNSFDLAAQVAEAVGPEKILGRSGGQSNQMAAAVFIRKMIQIDAPPKSSVIHLSFKHKDPTVVQPVLEKTIEFYVKKHLEIHRAVGIADTFLSQQTEQLRSRLATIEDNLWSLKTNSGSVSPDDMRGFSERRTKILQDLSTAEAQLEEKKAVMQDLQKFLPSPQGAPVAQSEVPVEKMNEYKNICAQLTSFRTNLTALLSRFNEDAPFVKSTQAQVTKWEKDKAKLEEQYPKLATLGISSAASSQQPLDLTNLSSEIRILEIKIKTYKGQLEQIRADELAYAKAQNGITQLQREKEVDEANYKYYEASKEQARIDETLGPGKISNIKTIQEPSPPAKAPSKTLQAVGGALAGGVFGGIGLAFLIEMFLDKTLKRPGDIKSRLNVPLFSTIPYLNGGSRGLSEGSSNGRRKMLSRSRKSEQEPNADDSVSAKLEVAPWEGQHRLQPFFQEMREQLINYFEARKMDHKPKLVAVTSCSKGAGVSTLAAGLAASLSETADGNVLLVDMNSTQGGAHPFYKGKPGCGLPDVFELEKREAAMVQEKLYMVKGSDVAGKISRLLPKGFSDLMPKILASDYDYVIFDMPQVSAGSITVRLAPHMDMVLMVLEAERTNCQTARNAVNLLAGSNTSVAPVLNKKREYIPSWLPLEAAS